MPIAKAREVLSTLSKEWEGRSTHEAVRVTRRGEPVLAILPWEFYDSLLETLEILSDKDLIRGIRQGIREASQGKLIPWERVKKDLNR